MKKLCVLSLYLLSSVFFDNWNIPYSEKSSIESGLFGEKTEIIALTDYNSNNYFIFHGQPMGFQYELLQEFSDYIGIKIRVIVNDNPLEAKLQTIERGEADILALNLIVNHTHKRQIDFSAPIMQTRQVLVQRKPDGWEDMTDEEISQSLITDVLGLAEKRVTIKKGSPYVARIKNLSQEIGELIFINEVNNTKDELLELVANGSIEYTLCDEKMGKANKLKYPNLDFATPVSFSQNIAWAVNKESLWLLRELNNWIIDFKTTKKFAYIYKKYFNAQNIAMISDNEYFIIENGHISKYDDLIKKYSKEIGWDWKLLASLIYQESHFNHSVQSHVGAFGLMQLMPQTAKRFGVNKKSSAEANIRAGVQYIQWLDKRFSKKGITDQDERVKFILAAYNIGYGHIEDAIRLTIKNGKNPKIWTNNVEDYFLKKSRPSVYTDPDVRHGYCKGIETYNYVNEIISRYDDYKNLIND